MPRVLIIGWGNPLRGDDGLGWRAAESLEAISKTGDITVRVSHQLMPEFADEISRAELVVFIDARCDNVSGEIRFEQIEPDCSPSAAFSHRVDPPALLGMARRLYGVSPEAFLFTVGGRSFEFGETLSPEVQSALPELIRRIQQLIAHRATPAAARRAGRRVDGASE